MWVYVLTILNGLCIEGQGKMNTSRNLMNVHRFDTESFYFTTLISLLIWYEKEDVEIVAFDQFSAQT